MSGFAFMRLFVYRPVPDSGTSCVTEAQVRRLTLQLRALSSKGFKAQHGSSQACDAVITHCEVNDRHGTGVLLQRLFQGRSGIISLRSQNLYGGRQSFGDLKLRFRSSTGEVAQTAIARLFDGIGVRRILCVPYRPEEAHSALALKEGTGAPICTYIMDDQNIYDRRMPDDLMHRLLDASALRLAISRELQSAYQRKFSLPVHYMPPLAPAKLVLRERLVSVPGDPDSFDPVPGVIIGNVWSPRWLGMLAEVLKISGVRLNWYFTGSPSELPFDRGYLAACGLFLRDPLPEEELVAVLRRSRFCVMPSGTLNGEDDLPWISRLSLPSRVPYVLATSHTPFIVLGSEETAAARFVRESRIGIITPYDGELFLAAVRRVMDPVHNHELRERAANLAPHFSDEGAADWIWRSLAAKRPIDDRFESQKPDAAICA
jgi:hypothetical protein